MKAAFAAALALSGLIAQGAQARDRDPAGEARRWQDVREPVFHGRAIQDAGEEVKLIAPDRAMDAALVPLTVELHAKKRVTAVTVFIDNNPAPVVGTFRFGPAISPDRIKFRVRINDYTLVHAVAETEDGALLAAEHYVKAAGGCSAPASGQTAETVARLGQMQLHRTRPLDGAGVPSQLLISHPNYNGMQSHAERRLHPGALSRHGFGEERRRDRIRAAKRHLAQRRPGHQLHLYALGRWRRGRCGA